MARIGEFHKSTAPFGKGLCSVPMWQGGCPAGFCDKPAFGQQTEMGRLRYPHYVPGLSCPGHGGPTLTEAIKGKTVLRFSGSPGPNDECVFVEAERDGKSVSIGDWVRDGDYWLLVLKKGASDA